MSKLKVFIVQKRVGEAKQSLHAGREMSSKAREVAWCLVKLKLEAPNACRNRHVEAPR